MERLLERQQAGREKKVKDWGGRKRGQGRRGSAFGAQEEQRERRNEENGGGETVRTEPPPEGEEQKYLAMG